MKAEKLFKTLIDGIFILQIFGFLVLIFALYSFSVVKINMQDIPIKKLPFLLWLLLFVYILSYVPFVIGVFYLKRLSKELLKEKYFSKFAIKNFIKTGKMFVVSGCLMISVFLIQFLSNFTDHRVKLAFSTEFISTLFIIAIGLFFLIQGKILKTASQLKQENDLTI